MIALAIWLSKVTQYIEMGLSQTCHFFESQRVVAATRQWPPQKRSNARVASKMPTGSLCGWGWRFAQFELLPALCYAVGSSCLSVCVIGWASASALRTAETNRQQEEIGEDNTALWHTTKTLILQASSELPLPMIGWPMITYLYLSQVY